MTLAEIPIDNLALRDPNRCRRHRNYQEFEVLDRAHPAVRHALNYAIENWCALCMSEHGLGDDFTLWSIARTETLERERRRGQARRATGPYRGNVPRRACTNG